MKKLLSVLILVSAVSACDKEPENLMSPCVGAKGSPCEHIPLNQQLIQKTKV